MSAIIYWFQVVCPLEKSDLFICSLWITMNHLKIGITLAPFCSSDIQAQQPAISYRSSLRILRVHHLVLATHCFSFDQFIPKPLLLMLQLESAPQSIPHEDRLWCRELPTLLRREHQYKQTIQLFCSAIIFLQCSFYTSLTSKSHR